MYVLQGKYRYPPLAVSTTSGNTPETPRSDRLDPGSGATAGPGRLRSYHYASVAPPVAAGRAPWSARRMRSSTNSSVAGSPAKATRTRTAPVSWVRTGAMSSGWMCATASHPSFNGSPTSHRQPLWPRCRDAERRRCLTGLAAASAACDAEARRVFASNRRSSCTPPRAGTARHWIRRRLHSCRRTRLES